MHNTLIQIYQTTQHHIAEHRNLHSLYCTFLPNL